MPNKKNAENAETYRCDSCYFKCSKKSNYDKHLLTNKHKILINPNADCDKDSNNKCVCSGCNKIYKHLSTLCAHKKKCKLFLEQINIVEPKQESETIKTLINENKSLKEFMVEQNADFKNLILEVCKNFQSSNTTNINNNSHNKTFNLQVFLNETCKDAMNIMDFADSIKLQLTDLENVGEQGFVNGISNIIIKSLQEMDVNLRPVHCSDLKREVTYVKENGKWEKDTPDNKLIKKAIKRVAHRNVRQIPEWRDKYPDCRFSDSKKSDQYNELIIEAMGGRGDNDEAKANKIVKKIIKNVVIDKTMV